MNDEYVCVSPLNLIEICSRSDEFLYYRHVYIDNRVQNYSMKYFLWNTTKCITTDHIRSCHSISSSANNDTCMVAPKEIVARNTILAFVKDPSVEYACVFTSSGIRGRRQKRFLRTSQLGHIPSLVPTPIPPRQLSKLDHVPATHSV